MTRGRKRIILSDNSDNESDGRGAAAIAAAPTGVDSGRPSRRTKEQAKKKWETLVPGQVRKKKKSSAGPASDSDADEDDLKYRKSTKAVKSSFNNSDQSHRSSDKSATRVSAGHPPDIDPNASSEAEDNIRKEDSIHLARTKGSKPHTDSHGLGDFSKQSVPPKYRKHRASDIVQDLNNEPTSSEEGDQEDDSTNEDKQEEYNTDKEDEELQAMEKHPQTLAKTFAQEAAYWVEEDNLLSPSRPQRHSRSKSLASARAPTPESSSHSRHSSSRPPPSSRSPTRSASEDADTAEKDTKSRKTKAPAATIGKKRVAREDSDAAESDAPPPKKPLRKATHAHASRVHDKTKAHADTPRSHVTEKTATNSKSANPSTKDASKRAMSKRDAEIPKFLKVADDVRSETYKPKAKSRTTSASSKVAVSKPALPAAGSDEDSMVDDASASESESEDSGIEIVFPAKGKLKLKEQHRRVRRVLKRGIHTMLVNVGLKNAFPDGPQKPGDVIYRALLKAAAEFGYDDLVKRLKKQDEYAAELSKIPSQRIPTFRGQVRKLVEGQPGTALGLTSGDKDKGDWLQEGLRYIYPFDYETKTISAGKPYSPPVFIETIRVAFFKRPSSFGFELSKQFESSLPDKPDEKELPAPMLALVATALHAAIEDCKYGHKQPRDFSSNDYWNVYKDHIQELSSIRRDGPMQYHVLMHGLWRKISAPMGNSAHAGAPRKSFLNVAAMSLE